MTRLQRQRWLFLAGTVSELKNGTDTVKIQGTAQGKSRQYLPVQLHP